MTYEEAYNESLEYFGGDEMAASTFLSKYALKDREGNYIESDPDQMHRRMAKEFARIEKGYSNPMREEEIYELFKNFNYVIPQGSVMQILGTDIIGSLSNCVVVDSPSDSYGGIMKSDEELAQLFKRRCGVGIDISTLRPAGSSTNNPANTSTGAVSFMERFSNTTREVAQGGRRGALMETIDIRHPDVEQFVKIKQDLSKVTGANISVKLRDDFMEAVENDDDYVLRFPIDADLSSKNGVPLQANRTIKARDLWNEIVSCAHNTAEPGLIFWDRQNNYSPSHVYDEFSNLTTNPCSEIAMGKNDTCRLIAINLYNFVKEPFTNNAYFDVEKFTEVTEKAMRLSDDLIDLEIEHIDRILEKIEYDPESFSIRGREYDLWYNIRETARRGRRTGLGITGLGDTLAALGLKYDSKEAKQQIEKIFSTKFESEWWESVRMSQERGSFPAWDPTKEYIQEKQGESVSISGKNDFFQFMIDEFPELAYKNMSKGRRNISISTVAPTGSLSIMAQVTSGIEPLFAPYYTRRKKINPNDEGTRVDYVDQNGDSWQEYPVIHERLKSLLIKKSADQGFKDNLIFGEGVTDLSFLQDTEKLEEGFKKSPYYGNTAPEIDWIDRVDVQSIVQKYTTHSISSTINLPSDVSVEKVKEIYMEAWKKGLKGITVYRDGARSGVLINKSEENGSDFEYVDAPSRPRTLPCDVYHSTSEGKDWIVAIGLYEGKPYEVFAYPKPEENVPSHKSRKYITKDKKKEFILHNEDRSIEYDNIAQAMSDEKAAITLLASGMLRHRAKIDYVTKILKKAGSHITSFVSSINRTLQRYNVEKPESLEGCPNDGEGCDVVREEGCLRCRNCGIDKCG